MSKRRGNKGYLINQLIEDNLAQNRSDGLWPIMDDLVILK
jgi:hypothetical protein